LSMFFKEGDGDTSVALAKFAPRRTGAPPSPGVDNPVSPSGCCRGSNRSSQVPVHNASFVTKCEGFQRYRSM